MDQPIFFPAPSCKTVLEFDYWIINLPITALPPCQDSQVVKYDEQDQQGKAASNERKPNKNQWKEAQADPKQKQDRAQGRARTG
jgi:hypothetical protein